LLELNSYSTKIVFFQNLSDFNLLFIHRLISENPSEEFEKKLYIQKDGNTFLDGDSLFSVSTWGKEVSTRLLKLFFS
jgi:hypothetical protein